MDAISAMREPLEQKFGGIIRFRDGCARGIDKLIQRDFELPRYENIVRVRSKTESDLKKIVDPESGTRSHAGEMSVHMIDPHLSQAQPNVNRLVEPQEIGAPP